MTGEKVNIFYNKFKRSVPKSSQESIRTDLAKVPDECEAEIKRLPTRSLLLTLVLSIFTLGLGVDRFYLGDIGMGIAKGAFRLVTAILFILVNFTFAPPRGIMVFVNILAIVSTIWYIADWFYTYKNAKTLNGNLVSQYLHQQLYADKI